MPKGRPRKNASVHLLDGTYRPREHDGRADALPAKGDCRPTRPLNEWGQREFAVVVAAYPAGTLGESDSESLTQYCEWVQRMFALRALEESTQIPQVKLAAEISKHCLHFAVRFGLTPADRGKVKVSTTSATGKDKFFGVTG